MNKNDRELKPRQEPLSAQNEVNDDGNLKNFYKPWKDDASVDGVATDDDYEERRRAAVSRQQQIVYDA